MPVVLYHVGFHWISGGFVGVDVFFVISGFLITSIILREAEAQQFSMLHFYERRARRILPALVFMLATCSMVAWVWMLPEELNLFGQSLSAVQVFSSNIYFWSTTNYFSPAADELPLLHTWSLAVEEQYYVLFPMLIVLCAKVSRRNLGWLLATLSLASLALAEWGARHSPVAAFYLLPTRAWELLAGSLLALAAPRIQVGLAGKHLVSEVGAAAGLVLIFLGMFTLDKSSHVPGVHALAPVLGTVLVIALGTRGTMVGSLLSWAPIVGIGLISYSTYLWHQPLIVFARFSQLDTGSPWVCASLALAALGFAAFSWRVVERPFRTRQLLADRQSLFLLSAISAAVLGGVGLTFQFGDGLPGRGDSNALRADVNQIATRENGWCFYNVDSLSTLSIGQAGLGCLLGDRTAPRRALLVGDSFAGHFEPFWDTVGRQLGLRIESISTNWCFPSSGDRYTGPATSRALDQCRFNRKHVAENMGQFEVIIVAADWRNVLKQDMMADATQFIRDAAKAARWVIVMPTPKRFDRDSFRKMQRDWFFGGVVNIRAVSSEEDTHAQAGNSVVRAFCGSLANVVFLDREQVFQVDGVPTDLTRDQLTYSVDGRHLSVHGSLSAAKEFVNSSSFAQLRTLISEPPSRQSNNRMPGFDIYPITAQGALK